MVSGSSWTGDGERLSRGVGRMGQSWIRVQIVSQRNFIDVQRVHKLQAAVTDDMGEQGGEEEEGGSPRSSGGGGCGCG